MRLSSPRVAIVIGVLASAALGASSSCSRSEDDPEALNGAGATLPLSLYARWSSELSLVEPPLRVNYQPLGSGAGVRQLSDGVVDFGAIDAPMTDEQLERAPFSLVHVPMTIGAIVVTYNAPGVTDLKLSADVIADVFRGVVERWDDPRMRDVNPGVAMPAQPITVVHRADGSGTSATFTAFLSSSDEAWRAEVGADVAPRFPVGVGARGNGGVTAYVKATPYSIGYVELTYARRSHLPIALVKNRAGNFVAPSRASLDRAARSALPRLPEDLRLSLLDPEDAEAYPIAALSFIILPRDAPRRPKAEALARLLWWGLHEGQRYDAALDYAPLPPELVTRAEAAVRRVFEPVGAPWAPSGT